MVNLRELVRNRFQELDVSDEHLALLDSLPEQTPEDMEFVRRMQ